jgi:hypothetical protein
MVFWIGYCIVMAGPIPSYYYCCSSDPPKRPRDEPSASNDCDHGGILGISRLPSRFRSTLMLIASCITRITLVTLKSRPTTSRQSTMFWAQQLFMVEESFMYNDAVFCSVYTFSECSVRGEKNIQGKNQMRDPKLVCEYERNLLDNFRYSSTLDAIDRYPDR